MKNLFAIFRRLFIASMACLFLGLYTMPVASASTQNLAYVRIIHASPFVGIADVFVDGTKLLSNFQFAAVTKYVPVPAGPHTVQIALVGKGINASALTQKLTVSAGLVYTVAALGTTPTNLSLQVFVDNNQVVANQAKVRVYHLSPDAGSVNVSIGEEASLKNMSYQDASDYVTVGSGPCMFHVASPQQNTTLPLSMMLDANTVTSIFTVGLFSGSPKVQLVSAQVDGIPALPGTGSDPNAQPENGQYFWLFGVVALFCLSIVSRPGIWLVRRLKHSAVSI